MPILFGLSCYGLAYAIVKFLGFTSSSFTALSYLYIILGLVIGLYYELDSHGGFRDILDNLVIVIEGDEMELKKILTGEKYRLKGEIEKVG